MSDKQLCTGCYAKKRSMKKCNRCKGNICKDCVSEIILEDWLFVQSTCSTCEKVYCCNCIVPCYDCHNDGDNYDMYCLNCLPEGFKKIDCQYHTWWTCGNHEIKCGQCGANRSYDNRHQLF